MSDTAIKQKSASKSSIKSSLFPDIVQKNNAVKNAKKYALATYENTYYLGYRDIPLLLEKHTVGHRALDYGCGTGRSTRFLKTFGFETIGVDISKEMLTQALTIDNTSHYLHIKNATIPVLDASCDLVFSCFVLFTVPTKKELLSIFKETYRCLKEEGIFIIVTGSEHLYSHDWLSYNTDFPENKNPHSGSCTTIELKDLGIEYTNYYWTDADYMELFYRSNFHLIEKHFPLGSASERKDWVSETKYPPYTIYVLQKN
jgi:ubiquinone/menaquinone biosynthesis C-methylase UbiE